MHIVIISITSLLPVQRNNPCQQNLFLRSLSFCVSKVVIISSYSFDL